MSSGVSSCAVCAAGTVFTGALFTAADGQPDGGGVGAIVPSFAVKVKLSVPLKFGFGV